MGGGCKSGFLHGGRLFTINGEVGEALEVAGICYANVWMLTITNITVDGKGDSVLQTRKHC